MALQIMAQQGGPISRGSPVNRPCPVPHMQIVRPSALPCPQQHALPAFRSSRCDDKELVDPGPALFPPGRGTCQQQSDRSLFWPPAGSLAACSVKPRLEPGVAALVAVAGTVGAAVAVEGAVAAGVRGQATAAMISPSVGASAYGRAGRSA
jgi:hypothetical protein